MATYALALDVGGTFTDVMLLDRASGQMWITKTPSTPSDPAQGFFAGVAKISQQVGMTPNTLACIFHGSTVATNAILEGQGAITGMITTAGFRSVLEIGRHDIPRRANMYAWVKPKRPVPPRRIVEVSERVLLDGSVATPLDTAGCYAAAEQLRALDVEAIAIVLLHAYANPTHEEQAAAIAHAVCPDVPISCSSQVLPVFREYERAMVTALNASLQPLVSQYVTNLESGLRARQIHSPLLIMQSNGGVCRPHTAAAQPVYLALSGPAAGAIGAGAIGQLADAPDALCIDMGGTSADVCLLQSGRPTVTHEGEIGDFPLSIPMTDIHTIGAGGGSIAQVTAQGGLTVGPRSAGAVPGPACYDQGGIFPTVTDANLVLGRLPPHLLDGEVPLNLDRARQAIAEHIAGPLGLDLYEAAAGIIEIVNNNMVGALRVVSVEKGYDPRDFALIAFGGAGPLHAVYLAKLLGTPRVVIPPYPGLLSALGLLATDLQHDVMRTFVQRGPTYDLAGMEAVYQAMHTEAATQLCADGVPPAQQTFQRVADLRYAKQGFEIPVDFPGYKVTPTTIERLIATFHQRHEQLYTYAALDTPVEIVNLRLRAVGHMEKPTLSPIETVPPGTVPAPTQERAVYFSTHGFTDTPVFTRHQLKAGHTMTGPAIIEQLDTTTVVPPEHLAQVDTYGNIHLRLRSDRR